MFIVASPLRSSVRCLGTSSRLLKRDNLPRLPPWLHEKMQLEGGNRENIFEVLKPKHGIHPDTAIKMQSHYEFSLAAFKRYRASKLELAKRDDQRYLTERVRALGVELAAATFLVHRGAAVKFHEFEKWIVRDEDGEYTLPRFFTEGYTVEAVDVASFEIMYTGIENLAGLSKLKSLVMKDSPRVDDWCLDAISAMFHSTLEFLDISGCPMITERGLNVLHRMKQLKHLNIANLKAVQNPQLMCIHLEDTLPNCKVVGVDYWNSEDVEAQCKQAEPSNKS